MTGGKGHLIILQLKGRGANKVLSLLPGASSKKPMVKWLWELIGWVRKNLPKPSRQLMQNSLAKVLSNFLVPDPGTATDCPTLQRSQVMVESEVRVGITAGVVDQGVLW